jgi:hypothetical protein
MIAITACGDAERVPQNRSITIFNVSAIASMGQDLMLASTLNLSTTSKPKSPHDRETFSSAELVKEPKMESRLISSTPCPS